MMNKTTSVIVFCTHRQTTTRHAATYIEKVSSPLAACHLTGYINSLAQCSFLIYYSRYDATDIGLLQNIQHRPSYIELHKLRIQRHPVTVLCMPIVAIGLLWSPSALQVNEIPRLTRVTSHRNFHPAFTTGNVRVI